MRKAIISTFVFFLLCGYCYAEETNDSLYIGTWVYQEETANGGFAIEALHLSVDHKVFYLRQIYDSSSRAYSWGTVGAWESTEKGVQVCTGEGYPDYFIAEQPGAELPILVLRYPSGVEYKSFIALSSDMLSRMADKVLASSPNEAPEEKPEVEPEEEPGVFVPAGFWEVGTDIPAGVYSIRKPDGASSQNFVIYEKYNEETGRYTRTIVNTILNKTNPIIGKVELREGNVVNVDEGVYFDEPVKLGF